MHTSSTSKGVVPLWPVTKASFCSFNVAIVNFGSHEVNKIKKHVVDYWVVRYPWSRWYQYLVPGTEYPWKVRQNTFYVQVNSKLNISIIGPSWYWYSNMPNNMHTFCNMYSATLSWTPLFVAGPSCTFFARWNQHPIIFLS